MKSALLILGGFIGVCVLLELVVVAVMLQPGLLFVLFFFGIFVAAGLGTAVVLKLLDGVMASRAP
jgi:hypothetical protein